MIRNFTDIPASKEVKQRLQQVLQQNRQPHLALYAGPEGNATLPLAWVVAKAILCSSSTDGTPCGSCSSCQAVDRGSHPDFHFFFPSALPSSGSDGKKDKLRAEYQKAWKAFLQAHPYGGEISWRQFLHQHDQLQAFSQKDLIIGKEEVRRLLSTISLTPYMGSCSVVFIWLPEMLYPLAAPALLKSLEEPQSRTMFILVTHRPWKLLLTLRSRAQLFRVPPFRKEEVADFLVSHQGMDQEQAHRVAKRCGNNLDQALQWTDTRENEHEKALQEWMRACWLFNPEQLISQAEHFASETLLWQEHFLRQALQLFRQVLLQKLDCLDIAPPSDQMIKFIRNFSTSISDELLEKLIERSNTMLNHISRHANAKMSFLSHSLQVAVAFSEQRRSGL